MKKLLLVFLILILGCRHSPSKSFKSLREPFLNWYFKYHPIEGYLYNQEIYIDNLLTNQESREEYYADLSRFFIELTQINETKLFIDDHIDYNIVYKEIEKRRFIHKNIKNWEWDPLTTIKTIYDALLLLYDLDEMQMELRISKIEELLLLVPKILNSTKNQLTKYSVTHQNYANKFIDGIRLIIKDIPLKIESDHNTMDKIDKNISKNIELLNNYQIWINSEYNKMEPINFPEDLNLIKSSFKYLVDEKYSSKNVYYLAEKKIIPIQNKMFNLALPIYLEKHDEPVWLDRDDTLDVIKWALKTIENKRYVSDDYLSHITSSIETINNFIKLKNLFSTEWNETITLNYSPPYLVYPDLAYLFGSSNKGISNQIIYYIRDSLYNESASKYKINKFEMDLINAEKIIPGLNTQNSFSKEYSSTIRYVFPNQINQLGWSCYASEIILDKGFGSWNSSYHLIKLKRELTMISAAIAEKQYYQGLKNKEEIRKFYIEQAFLHDWEINILQYYTDIDYFYNTCKFIGYTEIKNLKKRYENKMGKKFSILDFHQLILETGPIPIYELKKILLD